MKDSSDDTINYTDCVYDSDEESLTSNSDSDEYHEIFKMDKLPDNEKLKKKLKQEILIELINNGSLKTCKKCGIYHEKYAYRTRLCKDCHRVYSHDAYLKRKNKTK